MTKFPLTKLPLPYWFHQVKIPPSESPETTHISVVDANGNAVAITTTLNSSFGNKVMVKGAGFFLE